MRGPTQTERHLAIGATNEACVASSEERLRATSNDSVVRARTRLTVKDRRHPHKRDDPRDSRFTDSFEESQLDGWHGHMVAGRALYYVFEPPPKPRISLFERVRRALGLRPSISS